MKEYMLVDIMVDVSNNLIEENEFRNNLAEWVMKNNWELKGFIGEYREEEEDIYE